MGDKILLAFDQACQHGDLTVAGLLLVEYERIVARPPIHSTPQRRRELECLIVAHRTLWELLHANLHGDGPGDENHAAGETVHYQSNMQGSDASA